MTYRAIYLQDLYVLESRISCFIVLLLAFRRVEDLNTSFQGTLI